MRQQEELAKRFMGCLLPSSLSESSGVGDDIWVGLEGVGEVIGLDFVGHTSDDWCTWLLAGDESNERVGVLTDEGLGVEAVDIVPFNGIVINVIEDS